MRRAGSIFGLLGLLGLLGPLACAEPALEWAPEPVVPEHPGLRLERIWAAAVDGAIQVGGFDGAVLGSGSLRVIGPDGVEHLVTVDGRGRFFVEFPGEGEQIQVAPPTGPAVNFRVRRPQVARAAALWPPLGGAGLTPNDLVILGPKGAPLGALVRSGDHAVSPLDLQAGLLPESGRFLDRANPWFVAPVRPEGTEVVVSGWATGEIYRFDLRDPTRSPEIYHPGPPVELAEPRPLLEPRDVDGDGQQETEVRSYPLLSPQPVLVLGERVYAAYAGVISVRLGARGPVQLPATLVEWPLGQPEAPRRIVLPFHNPQELRALPDGRVMVVASGILDPRGDRVEVRSEGGVMVYDPAVGQLAETWALGDFGGGTALLTESDLWVGSLARPVLRRVRRAGGETPQDLRVNQEEVDSIFRMIELDGGLAAVPSFNTDRLHVLDLHTGALDPPPFFQPLEVGPGRPVFQGLQVVARRPGRIGLDFQGPDLFLLFGPGSVITPLELRKVLGP